MPAKSGIRLSRSAYEGSWIPAYAGMTTLFNLTPIDYRRPQKQLLPREIDGQGIVAQQIQADNRCRLFFQVEMAEDRRVGDDRGLLEPAFPRQMHVQSAGAKRRGSLAQHVLQHGRRRTVRREAGLEHTQALGRAPIQHGEGCAEIEQGVDAPAIEARLEIPELNGKLL